MRFRKRFSVHLVGEDAFVDLHFRVGDGSGVIENLVLLEVCQKKEGRRIIEYVGLKRGCRGTGRRTSVGSDSFDVSEIASDTTKEFEDFLERNSLPDSSSNGSFGPRLCDDIVNSE